MDTKYFSGDLSAKTNRALVVYCSHHKAPPNSLHGVIEVFNSFQAIKLVL
jgi:hypothetical protein